MRAIAAYLLLMLAFIELGLSIIVAGLISIALYERPSWIWSRSSTTDK